jgi:hypothetical protein
MGVGTSAAAAWRGADVGEAGIGETASAVWTAPAGAVEAGAGVTAGVAVAVPQAKIKRINP